MQPRGCLMTSDDMSRIDRTIEVIVWIQKHAEAAH